MSNIKTYCKYLIDAVESNYKELKECYCDRNLNDMYEGLLELYEFNVKTRGAGKIWKRDSDDYRIEFLNYSCEMINVYLPDISNGDRLELFEVFIRENQIKKILDEN